MRAPLLIALLLAAAPAAAHNLILEAYVVGETIEGEAFFSDGVLVGDAPITVTGPDGANLGETVTDPDGLFTFAPTEVVDHLLRLDAGAGHVAEVTVPAADLAFLGGVADVEGAPDAPAVAAADTPAAEDPALQARIEAAVARDLQPLLAQLDGYRARNAFLELMGAGGILAGLAGIALFALGARHARAAAAARPRTTPSAASPEPAR